jgi:hypothetical protein
MGLPVVFFLLVSLHQLRNFRRFSYAISISFATISMALVILVPILFLGTTYLEITLPFSNNHSFLQLDSLVDRMSRMWPNALQLIDRDNNALEWMLGRGLGGISFGQSFGEAHIANAADNLFLYLYVTFGMGFIYFFWISFVGLLHFPSFTERRGILFLCLFVYLMILGITVSFLETPCPAFFFGLLAGIKHKKGAHPTSAKDDYNTRHRKCFQPFEIRQPSKTLIISSTVSPNHKSGTEAFLLAKTGPLLFVV